MIVNLWEQSWPVGAAGDALRALASSAHLAPVTCELPPAPSSVRRGDLQSCYAWIESIAACVDIQADRTSLTYRSILQALENAPCLVLIQFETEPRLLAITKSARGMIRLIPPSLRKVPIPASKLRSALAGAIEESVRESLGRVLDELPINAHGRTTALHTVTERSAGETPIADAWTLKIPATRSLWVHLTNGSIPQNLARFLGAYGLEYGLWILSWILLGKWALEGRLDVGWLAGWSLLLLTLIPLHTFALWNQTKLAVSGARVVMRLLLEGSFRLDPEEMRYTGLGQLLARVLDSEALQALALNGGLLALVAGLEIIVSVGVLGFGAKAWLAASLLIFWMLLSLGLGYFYHRRRHDWTSARLDVTQELVERIVGHRTRLVQQSSSHWHDGEDESLSRYLDESRKLDKLNVAWITLVPRGWVIVGIIAIFPAVLKGPESATLVAAQVGGVLLAFNALQRLASAVTSLSGAGIALERARDLLQAARRTERVGDPAVTVAAASSESEKLLEVRDVSYRYPKRAAEAFRNGFLQVQSGDHVLLQGESGSGKSTFVALASGIRAPDSGLFFLKGIDRNTMGARNWRKRVVAAPQFHENHIITGSLAFNLLLGRRWPARPEDLAEAESVCRELGLGPLIDTMPSGLMQIVGETGWQLSNGEKTRVFLGRALLQDADLVILDETFGALDPETTQLAIDCVQRRAKTALCVAHL
jgi:ATP-binding cassette, subfamily B, bacterial